MKINKHIKTTDIFTLSFLYLFLVSSILSNENLHEKRGADLIAHTTNIENPTVKRPRIDTESPPAENKTSMVTVPQQEKEEPYLKPGEKSEFIHHHMVSLENPLVLKNIISFLVGERDANFMAVNKTFFTLGMEVYQQKNERCRHFPWHGKSLNARSLYAFNTHMRTFLGLYVNVKKIRSFL